MSEISPSWAPFLGLLHSPSTDPVHRLRKLPDPPERRRDPSLGWEGGFIPGFRFYLYKIGTSLRALRALAKFLILWQIKSPPGIILHDIITCLTSSNLVPISSHVLAVTRSLGPTCSSKSELATSKQLQNAPKIILLLLLRSLCEVLI